MRAEHLLNFLAAKTGWAYAEKRWQWRDLVVQQFEKGNIATGQARYDELMARNPLSLAVTKRALIEYTIGELHE